RRPRRARRERRVAHRRQGRRRRDPGERACPRRRRRARRRLPEAAPAGPRLGRADRDLSCLARRLAPPMWTEGDSYMTLIDVAEFRSALGKIVVAARDGRLCALEFAERWPRRRRALERRFGALVVRRAADPAGSVGALAAYFAGAHDAFARVPLDPGGTVFQRRVWAALGRIPPGRTRSYREL